MQEKKSVKLKPELKNLELGEIQEANQSGLKDYEQCEENYLSENEAEVDTLFRALLINDTFGFDAALEYLHVKN